MKLPRTKFQTEVYVFAEEFTKKNGYPPRYCDIQNQLKVKNPGSVHKAIAALEKKGWLTRNKGMHRGILIHQGVEL